MRVLLVTDNRYWRNEIGSQRRISSLCDYFVARGHLLEVLYTGYLYAPDIAKLKQRPLRHTMQPFGVRETSVATSSSADRLRHVRDLIRQFGIELRRRFQPKCANSLHTFRDFSLQVKEPKLAYYESASTLHQFRTVCQGFAPEVVLVEYVRLAWILKSGANAIPAGCLKLIDTHDVQCERQSRFHMQGELHDIDITPAEEAVALRHGDVVIAIQGADAEKLRRLVPDRKVIVVGFPSEIKPHAQRSNCPVRIGFFGSSMMPNRRAAERLIYRLFPTLRERHGAGVELQIFGGICAVLDQANAGAGVHFGGFVDDLGAAYEDLDIIANPVDFGGGLKIKNVEALCHGRPLVTTAIGAEGLEQGAGLALWLAADDEDFIRKLDQLIGDAELRFVLGNFALDFAKQNFGEDAVFRALDEMLSR